RVLADAGGEHLAENDLVHALGGDAGAPEQGADHDRAEFVCRYPGEGAAEGADGGSGGVDDDDFLAHDENLRLFAAARRARTTAMMNVVCFRMRVGPAKGPPRCRRRPPASRRGTTSARTGRWPRARSRVRRRWRGTRRTRPA